MKTRTRLTGMSVILLAFASLFSASYGQAPESKFFVTSDGVKIHYVEAGKGDTILFVPGGFVPLEVWEAQVEHFSRSHHVVAMDPRSQGSSEKATEGHNVTRRGRDIGELAGHISQEPVVVVAWSVAVLETLSFVRESGAERFKALVLVDMFLGVDEGPDEPHPNTRGWTNWIRGLQFNRQEWTLNWIKGFYKNKKPDEYYERIAKLTMKIPTNSAVTILTNLMLVDERDFRPFVDRLRVPVFYVLSSNSWSVERAAEARKRWPKMRVEVVENTGHAIFADRPDEFNKLLSDFIGGLD